jgi:hypothetical protein
LFNLDAISIPSRTIAKNRDRIEIKPFLQMNPRGKSEIGSV